jgi:hypothetical protein
MEAPESRETTPLSTGWQYRCFLRLLNSSFCNARFKNQRRQLRAHALIFPPQSNGKPVPLDLKALAGLTADTRVAELKMLTDDDSFTTPPSISGVPGEWERRIEGTPATVRTGGQGLLRHYWVAAALHLVRVDCMKTRRYRQ